MNQPTPFHRASRTLAVFGAIQAPLAFLAGLCALPGNPFSDPYGPITTAIALGYLVLGILCLSALPGFALAKRPMPHSRAGRAAWMFWITFTGFTNLLTFPALCFAAWFVFFRR